MPDRVQAPGQSVDAGCPFFDSDELTERESEALGLAAHGWTSVEIGRLMWITPRTAEAHLQNARLKLNARNTCHAVAVALSRQLIEFNTQTAPSR